MRVDPELDKNRMGPPQVQSSLTKIQIHGLIPRSPLPYTNLFMGEISDGMHFTFTTFYILTISHNQNT